MNTIHEEFKAIPGLPGYWVSALGNVLNPEGDIIEPNQNRYNMITILGKTYVVSRLVLTVWDRPPKEGEQARHGLRGSLCDELSNLQWGTAKENCYDKYKHSGVIPGGPRPVTRSDGKEYSSATEAAKDMNVSDTSIGQACRGLIKTCRGYYWRYTDELKTGAVSFNGLSLGDHGRLIKPEVRRYCPIMPRRLRQDASGEIL